MDPQTPAEREKEREREDDGKVATAGCGGGSECAGAGGAPHFIAIFLLSYTIMPPRRADARYGMKKATQMSATKTASTKRFRAAVELINGVEPKPLSKILGRVLSSLPDKVHTLNASSRKLHTHHSN